MLRHDLRRALLSPRTLFVALAYGVLLSLGATETWNDSAAYQFAFSYKTGFYIHILRMPNGNPTQIHIRK